MVVSHKRQAPESSVAAAPGASFRGRFWTRLRKLTPEGVQIRHRLLLAGTALTILALMTPLYMRSKLRTLTATYGISSSNWETLGQIHEFSQLLSDSEQNKAEMKRLLTEVMNASAGRPDRIVLLKELMNEPSQPRRHELLNQIVNDIHRDNVTANTKVLKASQSTILTVTYGGLLFFAGLAALMLSLWFTLIPGLEALMHSARELKAGNLDHHVRIQGHNEISEVAHAFNEMAVSLKAKNEKMLELSQVKSDFVSTVSHELRTPLTAIKGSIGLILGGITGPLSPETSEMLNITQKNTDRLIRLINEVLDVAKIEAGAIKMQFEKHSIVDSVTQAVSAIDGFAREQGVNLVWQPPALQPLVVIDRDRIVQVVTNLLSNAIKYTDRGGTITTHCQCEKDQVIVEVTDTGRGIPPEFLDRIFQKFQQAENPTHKAKEGSGLGLTIAKAIVEEHKGSIWVRSKEGVGSTFAFSVPWNGTEVVEPKKETVKIRHDPTTKSILLIDDEQDFTTVMSKLLAHEGYEALVANSGEEGFTIAAREQPDLIILDVLMPGLNGFAVHKLLSSSSLTRDIPVVFATISPDMKNEAMGKYDVPVLEKPLVPDDFKNWLREYFSKPKLAA